MHICNMHGESLTTKWGGFCFHTITPCICSQMRVLASLEEVGGGGFFWSITLPSLMEVAAETLFYVRFFSSRERLKPLEFRKCRIYLTNVQLPERVCVLKCVMTSWHLWRIFWRVTIWSLSGSSGHGRQGDLPMDNFLICQYLHKLASMWGSNSGIVQVIKLLHLQSLYWTSCIKGPSRG